MITTDIQMVKIIKPNKEKPTTNHSVLSYPYSDGVFKSSYILDGLIIDTSEIKYFHPDTIYPIEETGNDLFFVKQDEDEDFIIKRSHYPNSCLVLRKINDEIKCVVIPAARANNPMSGRLKKVIIKKGDDVTIRFPKMIFDEPIIIPVKPDPAVIKALLQ
jgi:hypothetical protein